MLSITNSLILYYKKDDNATNKYDENQMIAWRLIIDIVILNYLAV